MPAKGVVLFLPGFLGRASDWLPIWDLLNQMGAGKYWEFHSLSYFESGQKWGPELDLTTWADQLNQSFFKENPNRKCIILGYSLGGRLALHLLLSKLSQWQGGVIVSSHPGLENQADRDDRLSSDSKWAEKFLKLPWDELMDQWNGQGVLANDKSLAPRIEADFDRERLSLALKNWSLAKQDDFRHQLARNQKPLLWITGARDSKFTTLAESLPQLSPRIEVRTLSGAGHRLPWERSDEFCKILFQFLMNQR